MKIDITLQNTKCRQYGERDETVIFIISEWSKQWSGRPGFNPRSRHSKDFKNGTCYIHSCLTLSNIRYVSKVKWSNPGKGVAPSPTTRCSGYWKKSLLVALDYGCQLYFTLPNGIYNIFEPACVVVYVIIILIYL